MMYGLLKLFSFVLFLFCFAGFAHSQNLNKLLPSSSITEVHYQYGNQKNPLNKQDTFTTVITTQNASNWGFGTTFFFLDYVKDSEENDGVNFNDENWYFEGYLTLSYSKLIDPDFSVGPLKDIGLMMGTNYSRDPDILKWTPGLRLSWDVPGFAFLNTDFLGYLDDSPGKGQNARNAPAEDDSWFIDVNYLYPFSFKDQKFMVTGHAEFIKGRDLDDPIVSGTKKDWFLAQTQLRWDLGNALLNKPNKLFIGTEHQYWNNKLGSDVDEHIAQALVAIRF